MYVKSLVAASLGCGALLLSAHPATGQLRANRPPPVQANLPRLVVANPYSFSSQDSTAAVRVGHGMREEITGSAEKWFRTVTRVQMNEALQQYAYPVDALLPPMVARQLAAQLGPARALVLSNLIRGEGNRYTVEARLAGINDDAGQVVRLTQNANESFEDFGKRVAQALQPAFKALPDARECEAKRQTEPAKAAEEAAKAIKNLPNSGLAHYCLAQIAIARKGPSDSIVAHLKAATEGDPQSLPAWTGLAVQYQAKNDSAATVATFQQMLRIAPTNEQLRKDAFRLFLNYGRTGAAEEIAEEGLRMDPANADLWDLKSNACLFQDTPEKTRCAIESLEKVYEIDTTKADTTFFTKITFAASRPSLIVHGRVDSTGKVIAAGGTSGGVRDTTVAVVDSVRFLKWAQRGHQKYPENAVLLGQLAEAYSRAGPVDSAVSVTKQLMARDSSDMTPVLRVIQKLAEASRIRDAIALGPYVERLGSSEDKQNYAAILIRPSFALMQAQPQDWVLIADAGREIVKFAGTNAQATTYGSYLLGLGLFQQVAELDTQAQTNKAFSCELGQKLKAMLAEAEPALNAGKSVAEAVVTARLNAVPQFNKHLDAVIKQYCK
jgi:tetratricopeptide (TPR) repeat protein